MYNLNKISTHKPNILGLDSHVRSSIILPLVEKSDGMHLLFEVRSLHLTHQPGEVCFPGGKMEANDINEEMAALRETCEELGLTFDDLEIIGQLDTLVTPFNFILYSYVAKILNPLNIVPEKDEVKEVFTVPLDFFLKNEPIISHVEVTIGNYSDNYPFHLVPNGKDYPWRYGKYPVLFYTYEDKTIWGITARLIYEFVKLLKK